jgi:DNA processing protein
MPYIWAYGLMVEEPIYQIALKLLDGVGPQRARRLVSYCGGVRELFEATKGELRTVPGVGNGVVRTLDFGAALKKAEEAMKVIEQQGWHIYFYLNEDYPTRLKHCNDAPVVLYGLGHMDLNPMRMVSIVGTRNNSAQSQRQTEALVDGLAAYGASVTSGLALGIDTVAHRASLKAGIPTIGVLGSSLERVYPSSNQGLAKRMQASGGLLSEFEFGTQPDRENFPQRNRVVAGMSDVTVVIETKVKGGSMITARMALGYNRDVAAFPGRADDEHMAGCNQLIKQNVAALIEHADDLAYVMGWEKETPSAPTQRSLFIELDEDETRLRAVLEVQKKASIDQLSLDSGLSMSKTASSLLSMEFKGAVKSLPGKWFELV